MSKTIFFMNVAGLNIKVTCHYNSSLELCKDYLVEECQADIEAIATREEIIRYKENLPQNEAIFEHSEGYLEELYIHRSIAEQLPRYNRFVFHGAAIKVQDKGYLFTAPSGTGKSTHIRFWRKYLGEQIDIVNGDKPILSIDEEGVTVYGTPWAGKERWQKNHSVKLAGLCFLHRGTENRICRIEPAECLEMLINQVYLPHTEEMVGKTLELLNQMLETVPVYVLECDMSEDAVRCSFEAMTGMKYDV